MPSNEVEAPARKILPIIYVIDTSGSMAFERIGAVNAAMYGTVDVMKDIARKEPNAEIKIGILTFASGAEWVTKDASGKPSLIYMEDFFWNDLQAGGLTDIGEALKELHDKMSRSSFFSDEIGYKMPVLIFMSDGEPTDDWEGALKKINANNKWFRYSTKICVAVEGADKDVLARIAGRDGRPNTEAVVEVNDTDTLKKLIKVVSATASKIGSVSRTDSDVQADILREVAEEMEKDDGIVIEQPTEPLPSPSGVDDPYSGDPSTDLGGWDDDWDD